MYSSFFYFLRFGWLQHTPLILQQSRNSQRLDSLGVMVLICYLLTTAVGLSSDSMTSEQHLHRHARERKLVGSHGAQTTGTEVGSLLAQCGVATVAIYFPGFHLPGSGL